MTYPCGCGGNAALTCRCIIDPGDNVTITGTGNPEDHMVISAATTSLAVTDTATVDHTLAGDSATGYTLSSDVQVSGDAQNALVAHGDGLFVQSGSEPLATGCGIEGDGSAAAPVQLASPQTISGYITRGPTTEYTSEEFCAGVTFSDTALLTVTNPSACQSMILDVTAGGRMRFSALDSFSAPWLATLTFTLLHNGADAGVFQSLECGRRLANAEYYWEEVVPVAPVTLAPGAAATFGFRLDGAVQGPCEVDGVLFNPPGISVVGHTV